MVIAAAADDDSDEDDVTGRTTMMAIFIQHLSQVIYVFLLIMYRRF